MTEDSDTPSLAKERLDALSAGYLYEGGRAYPRATLALGTYLTLTKTAYPQQELEEDIKRWGLIDRPDLLSAYLRARFDDVDETALEQACRQWGVAHGRPTKEPSTDASKVV